MKKVLYILLIMVVVVLTAALAAGIYLTWQYNKLVEERNSVVLSWEQVEQAYQPRADLLLQQEEIYRLSNDEAAAAEARALYVDWMNARGVHELTAEVAVMEKIENYFTNKITADPSWAEENQQWLADNFADFLPRAAEFAIALDNYNQSLATPAGKIIGKYFTLDLLDNFAIEKLSNNNE